MSLKQMFLFLADLEQNNTFTWMHEHEKEYKAAKQIFLDFAHEILFQLGKQDSSYLEIDARKRMGRLVRDTRFSKDKTPYHPRFTLHMSPYGNEPIPCGPFLCLKNGESMVGGGLFLSSFAPATQRIRTYIAAHSDDFLDLIDTLQQHGIVLQGEQLKRVPKEFDPESPVSPYLKYKSWYVEITIPNSEDDEQMMISVLNACEMVAPLNEFLNQALGELRLPKRS